MKLSEKLNKVPRLSGNSHIRLTFQMNFPFNTDADIWIDKKVSSKTEAKQLLDKWQKIIQDNMFEFRRCYVTAWYKLDTKFYTTDILETDIKLHFK